MLVKRVDQGDEAGRLVAPLGPHHRNPDDDHGVIAPRDGEVIGGAARLAAQPLEREYRDALQALGHVERASPTNRELLAGNLGAILDRIVRELEEGAA